MAEPKVSWKKTGSKCGACGKPMMTQNSWVSPYGTVVKRVCRTKDCTESA